MSEGRNPRMADELLATAMLVKAAGGSQTTLEADPPAFRCRSRHGWQQATYLEAEICA